MSKDIIGKAIRDFHNKEYTEDIKVIANDFDDDKIPIPYLFRNYEEMPIVEQKALDLAYGNVLDVGCGAGSHSLYIQDIKKHTVTAIDTSAGAIETCIDRGVKNALHQDLYNFNKGTYDTILFLMNGSGIISTLSHIDHFFTHIKTLLAPGGQILMDSSDISYLFQEDDGSFWIDASDGYYGEMNYTLSYKEETSESFNWLYLDFNTLQNAANNNGFVVELIAEGDHHEFLAKLTLLDS